MFIMKANQLRDIFKDTFNEQNIKLRIQDLDANPLYLEDSIIECWCDEIPAKYNDYRVITMGIVSRELMEIVIAR